VKIANQLTIKVGLSLALTCLPILRTASAQSTDAGKQYFAERCLSCHALAVNKKGPPLGDVLGRVSGTADGFQYSVALKRAKVVWDAETLDNWLTNPEGVVADNKMYYKVEEAEVRTAIIAYLESKPK
jgi:cytochrome c